MSNIDKHAELRKELSNPANGSNAHLRKLALALLDELEAKDKRLNEILTPNMLLPVIDDMDAGNLRHVVKTASENYSLLHAKWEAAEKRIAELSHHLQSAHAFIEHTEAFSHEASNGILCCGDAQWNIDESKSDLAAAGKGA
ncbi:hypothetical protein ABIH54_003748 [Enterobacter bugandensis]